MASVPQPKFSIREARPEDVAPVSELGTHVFTLTFGYSLPAQDLQAYLNEFYTTAATAQDIADPKKDMIVAASQDGTVVGFALLNRGSSEPCVAHLQGIVELQRIYVHPDYHGHGIGKILANTLEDMAREQGFKHMWLGVWEENHKAQKVYEKLGYRRAGDHGFTMGGVVQTDFVLAKEL